MGFPYLQFIQWFLIAQFAFIGLHLVAALFLTPILTFFSRRKERKLKKVKQLLIDCAHGQTPPYLPRNLCKIPVLIPAVIALDREFKDPYWKELKQSLFEMFLFPQAQKLMRSRKWTKRIQVIGCFSLFPDPRNEPYLLELLKDTTPMIQYGAAFCAAQLGTAACTNAILDEMNHSDRFLRHPFREAFFKGNSHSFQYIEERLASDEDPLTHVSCLEVLAEQMNPHIADLARSDLHSTHKNLRIAAIRALGRDPNPSTIAALLSLLNDSEWEVRAIAARSLGYLRAKEALGQLSSLLKDSVWWVRMNAALALKRLGAEGIQVLEGQDPRQDRFAHEIAQYVLPLSLDG